MPGFVPDEPGVPGAAGFEPEDPGEVPEEPGAVPEDWAVARFAALPAKIRAPIANDLTIALILWF